MKQYKNRTYTLRLLTGITALMLAGIIALQVYWLQASYTEQRSRFAADIENAVLASVIRLQMDKSLHQATRGAVDSSGGLSDVVSGILSKIPKEMLEAQSGSGNTFTISITDSTLQGADMEQLAAALQKAADSGNKHMNITLGEVGSGQSAAGELLQYKNAFKKELDKRNIIVPFELALLDSAQHIQAASCDTQVFRNIPIKSAVSDFARQIGPGGYNLQAAFPDANLYLLRRMAWILIVTVLLILTGGASLSYLLVLFFRQKKLADIRNDFMNNMTHELKTPISSVAVALEMVLDTRRNMEEDKKTQYLHIAQGELKRLNMLVENVLKISSFERSEIRIAKEPVVVMPWLLDIESSLKPVLDRKGAQLLLDVRPELLTIAADKTHFTNVMQNLIENALKYNDKEMPRIRISIREEDDHVRMDVADNGKGIPGKYVDKVFDKFFRVPSGDRHDIKGYGLGLSYVKAVVELHDGSVSVESIPGEGSTFTIYLPEKK